MKHIPKSEPEKHLQGTKNSVASCSPDQTHIQKGPEWPFALTLLYIEVLTSSLDWKKNTHYDEELCVHPQVKQQSLDLPALTMLFTILEPRMYTRTTSLIRIEKSPPEYDIQDQTVPWLATTELLNLQTLPAASTM
jgi:hypothetical protein